jgi:hypothetical protein
MTDPNVKALDQARANVAARYNSRYHVNAILGGSWDRGYLVRDELQRLLKEPERDEGDE